MAQDKRIIPYPGPGLRRDQIANRLNMLHFRQQPVLVIIRHMEYGHSLTLKAHPQISHGEKLKAAWDKNEDVPRNLHQYQLDKILIPGMANTLELKTEKFWMESEFLQAELPEKLPLITSRKTYRHPGLKEITASITQHSIRFVGSLVDYSAHGMRLGMQIHDPESLYWFNPEQPVFLTLNFQGEIVFAAPVTILREESDRDHRMFVVAPVDNQVPRYRPKTKRTKRLTTQPSPDLVFTHPLTGIKTTLLVKDISTLGCSVTEHPTRATLIPGMILNDVQLEFFGDKAITFVGQVVYRIIEDEKITCGIAILNITPNDHFRLIGVVHRAENENAYVRLNQDPEKFFEFLFDSGFLYPAKYEHFHAHRADFLKAYENLYLNPNHIARCFVYLENGEIYGHVSALKIYRHNWLNHHHAAATKRRSGLRVLRQISDFHNDSYVLNPLQMRYVTGIWRADNSFPQRFFGSFVDKMKNPKMCSTDVFSYHQISLDTCKEWDDLKGTWEIGKANRQDMREFESYYEQKSGGLLTRAFDLTVDSFDDQSVAREYASTGLKRERHLMAVRCGMELKALVEVQDSDMGLNLSELTTAIYIYILDDTMITPKVLDFIECMAAIKLRRDKATVMLYPHTYAMRYDLEAKKEYTVWLITTECSDEYMQPWERRCR